MHRIGYPFTLLIVFFCFFSPLYAQQQANRLSLALGIGHLSRQDQIFSPFVHRDVSPFHLSLQYERDKKLKQKAQLSFSQFNPSIGNLYTYWRADPEETFTTAPHSFILVNIDYGLAWKIRKSEPWQISIGGMLQNKIQASSYNFGSFGGFGYLASLGIGPWLETDFHLSEKRQLSASLSVPLLIWVARSPYLINDDEFMHNTYSHQWFKTFLAYLEDGHWETIHGFQNVDIQLTYRHALNAQWDLLGEYRFSFTHHKEPANFLSYQHMIVFGGSLKF